jgi:hypothetical protein
MNTHQTKSEPVDAKDDTLFFESVAIDTKQVGIASDVLPMPESLRALSEDDMERLRKTMRWKLDLLIMPIMVCLCG